MSSLTLLGVNTGQAHPLWLTSTMFCRHQSVGQTWILVEANMWLALRRDRRGHKEQVVSPVALVPPRVAPLTFLYPHGGGFQKGLLTSLPCIAPACHPALHPRVEVS